MTTIAYKDGIIATDTLVTRGGFIQSNNFDKLTLEYLSDGTFVCYAFSGNVSDVNKARYYIRQGDLVDKIFDCLSVIKIYKTKDGEIIIAEAEDNLFFEPVSNEPIALGSGLAIALTAMDLGCNSVEAVRQAIERDVYTGGDIKYIDLNEDQPEIRTINT